MPETLRVGFVGIGRMGWPMARNIAAAGFPLTVYDADSERAARFAAETGAATASADLEALGREADVVVTMLPTGRDVRDAVLGANGAGVAAGLARGAVVVDMSSSDPLGTRGAAGSWTRPSRGSCSARRPARSRS